MFDLILREKSFAAELYDPHIGSKESPTDKARIYFIVNNHDTFKNSIVFVPWKISTNNRDIELVSIGRN